MFLRLTSAGVRHGVCAWPLPQPAVSSPAAFAIQRRPAGEADEVLAKAKEIYAADGPETGAPVFERALSLYRGPPATAAARPITLGLVGNCHIAVRRLSKATRTTWGRALALKRELGDRLEEGKTLSHIGLVYWEMGEYPPPSTNSRASIAIGREVGDRQLEGAALNNLSLVYDELGDYRRSLEQLPARPGDLSRHETSSGAKATRWGTSAASISCWVSTKEALRYYQQSLAISERLKMKPSASQDLGNLALCYVGLGQIPQGIDHFDPRAAARPRRPASRRKKRTG